MIAIVLALALQAEARPAYVRDDGWTYHGSSTGFQTMFFTRPGPNARMIWSRFEMLTPEDGVRSYRQLDEANCATGQLRTLQQHAFSQPNLEGPADTLDGVSAWKYPAPDTFAETAYSQACHPK